MTGAVEQDRGGGSGAGIRPRSTAERIAVALFAIGLVASLFVFVHPWYDWTNDGSTYVLTARSIAAGEGYRYLGEPFRIRPPGLSAMLAPLVGEGSTDFTPVNLLISLFGAAGVLLLYLHQRPHLGWVLALATAAAVWLNPGYQRLCNQVMSDVPGLALLLACLLLQRRVSRRPSWRRRTLLGLAIGAAAYVRSITVLLVPAFIASRIQFRLRNGRRRSEEGAGWWDFFIRRVGPVAVTVWLVLLPWNVTKRLAEPEPPADQTLNHSISTAMWHVDPGDPASPRYTVGEILSRVPYRLNQAALVLGSRMQHRIPGSPEPGPLLALGYAAVAVVLLACLLVAILRRGAPAEWFAAGTLFVVSIYFVFTHRLVLPVYVFALAATVEFLRDLAGRLAGRRAATIVPAAALLLLVAVDFAPRRDWDVIEGRHRAFVEMASAMEGVLEPDARLGAGQGFHYGVYLDRPVYSLVHAVRRAGRIEAAEQIIDKYDLNRVVLSPLIGTDHPFIPYFTERYGSPTSVGPAMTWRVRP